MLHGAAVKCYVCDQKFRDGDQIVPILTYVVNEKRGNWITSQPQKALHAYHLRQP